MHDTTLLKKIREIIHEEIETLLKTYEAPQLVTPEELAEILSVQVTTLAIWRSNSKGPKYTKKCGIRYRMSDINKWLEEED